MISLNTYTKSIKRINWNYFNKTEKKMESRIKDLEIAIKQYADNGNKEDYQRATYIFENLMIYLSSKKEVE